jgi:hypothetical protein
LSATYAICKFLQAIEEERRRRRALLLGEDGEATTRGERMAVAALR